MSAHELVALLGFGGPTSRAEIRPFLDRVLAGRTIPAARYEAVVGHYERIGGASPFNALTQRQARALQIELRARGRNLPVRVAYLNAPPFLDDLAREIGTRRALAIVLSVFQSPASWQRYQRLPGADYAPPYFDRPLFVQAYAERARDALRELGRTGFDGVELIFTAHSIPQAVAGASPYAQQFVRSAELVARAAGAGSWRVAYQSRSGSPGDAWLEPDVRDELRALAAQGIRQAIVVPIGFLCDHVEVLYDLDVDAAAVAAAAGVRMARARALNDHPLFIRLLADFVDECAGSP